MATYPEVESIVAQLGRPDDGTDTAGFLQQRVLRAAAAAEGLAASWSRQTGWRQLALRPKRPRTKDELITAMNAELERKIPGMVWNFSQNIRDNVMEALSGIKGDNSVKIFGPDLDKLETAGRPRSRTSCKRSTGIENVGIFHIAASRTWSSASIRRSARSGA